MEYKKSFSLSFLIICLFYAPILQPYIPKTNFGPGIPDFGFYEISIFLWLIFFFLDLAFRRFKKSGNCSHKLWLFFLGLYTIIVCFSVLWSYESYTPETLHALFFTVFIPFIVALISKYYIQQDRTLRLICFNASISCIFLSIASIIHFIAHQGHSIKEIRGGFGGLENPNAMAIFLVLNVPLLLYGIYKKFLNKKIGLISLTAILFGVLATISRKGTITLAATYLIFLFLNKKIKLFFMIIIIFSLIAGIVIGRHQIISQRYTNLAIKKEFLGKWNMTVAGFKMFVKKPLYGWGFKGYYNKFGEYFKHSYRKKYDAHNNYITALANYGILGFIPFMGIFLFPLLLGFRKIRRNPIGSKEHIISATLLSMLLPFMISAWFAGALMYQPVITNLFYFYIVLFICMMDKVEL